MKKENGKYTNLFKKQLEVLDELFNDCLSIMKDNLKPEEELNLYEFYSCDDFNTVYYMNYNEYGEKVLSIVDSILYTENNEIVLWYNDSADKDKIWENVYDYQFLITLYRFLTRLYRIDLV